jgi:hypothetical protein
MAKEGIVRIILNAVDNYTKTISGLDDALNYVGKTLGALKDIAGAAFNAVKVGAEFAIEGIKKAVDLAALGGAFDEQRNQFENLANAYKVNGQEIIDVVKKTAQNTISEFDSIAVATKALAAGLRGEEMETALSYIKRWTEATGQSFTDVAEKVFTSLSSGRFSVLRQMGLVIENGASLEDVLESMREGLKRFGDSGFNTADKLASLTAAQDDFTRKIGQAINQNEFFQKSLTVVSDAVVAFVRDFDIKPVKVFFDAISQAVADVAESALKKFPSISAAFELTRKDIIASATSLALKVSDIFFDLAKSTANAFNVILDGLKLTGAAEYFGIFVKSAIDSAAGLSIALIEIVGRTLAVAVGAVETAMDTITRIIEASPSIANALGIDAQEARAATDRLGRLADDIDRGTSFMSSSILGLRNVSNETVDGINSAVNSWRLGLGTVDDAHKRVSETIGAVGQAAKETYGYISASEIVQFQEWNQRAKEEYSAIKDTLTQIGQIDEKIGAEPEWMKNRALQDAGDMTSPIQDMARVLSGANWPSEFSALGEFLFKWVLSSALGSPVPMAITTGT